MKRYEACQVPKIHALFNTHTIQLLSTTIFLTYQLLYWTGAFHLLPLNSKTIIQMALAGRTAGFGYTMMCLIPPLADDLFNCAVTLGKTL